MTYQHVSSIPAPSGRSWWEVVSASCWPVWALGSLVIFLGGWCVRNWTGLFNNCDLGNEAYSSLSHPSRLQFLFVGICICHASSGADCKAEKQAPLSFNAVSIGSKNREDKTPGWPVENCWRVNISEPQAFLYLREIKTFGFFRIFVLNFLLKRAVLLYFVLLLCRLIIYLQYFALWELAVTTVWQYFGFSALLLLGDETLIAICMTLSLDDINTQKLMPPKAGDVTIHNQPPPPCLGLASDPAWNELRCVIW